MTTEPQSPIYNQPGWRVETVIQSITYITAAENRPPLWTDVPSMPNHFVGRDAIVAELADRLTAGRSVALSAEGKPGVGKTTLAVALAHHRAVLAHFSDGVLWAGLGPQPDLPSRLARWADALGVDVSNRPTVEARAQAVRDAIGHRRLLLVIDDVWQLEAAEHLRCGGPNCAHLLTSRDQRLALQFAGRSQRVEELTPADALELLRNLAAKAVAADETQAAGLLAAVGYLPLAVELLGGYLAAGASARFAEASRSALADLTDPARRLALATRRLGDGSGQRMSLEEVISLSIDGLTEESAQAADAFYCLGAFAPKPAIFDRVTAQAVAQCDADALALLIERNLLEEDDADESLALHQTIADIARTRTSDEAKKRHQVYYRPSRRTRQTKFYLAWANAHQDDLPSMNGEYPQIMHAWQNASPIYSVDFVDAYKTYQTRLGLWTQRLAWVDRAVETVKENPDVKREARMLNELGIVYSALDVKEKALGYFSEALPLYRQMGDRSGEATTLSNIGAVYSAFGEKEKALGYYGGALPLLHQMGDRSGEATTLNNIGLVYADLGEKGKALGYYEEAMQLSRMARDRSVEATTLNNIGRVYADLGEVENALGYYEQALPLSRREGDHSAEAMTLNNIGDVYRSLGEMQNALGYYEEVLLLSRRVVGRCVEATTLNNIGDVYRSLGEMQKALSYYGEARGLFLLMSDPSGEATALTNIGTVHSALGEKERALQFFERSIELRIQVGDQFGEVITRWWLASLYQGEGNRAAAITELEKALSIAIEVHSPNAPAIERRLVQLRTAQ